ncbi:L-xylulose reductase [Geodia barretti]|nr:L-xylulose reductase [Geodia barretti]
MSVNLKAPVFLSQYVARGMVERGDGGAIVNVSSVASSVALTDHLAYCTSKAGMDMATKVMALELGPHKIRVNAVNPTVVMTDMGKMAWSDPVKSSNAMTQIPLGRFAGIYTDPTLSVHLAFGRRLPGKEALVTALCVGRLCFLVLSHSLPLNYYLTP